MFLYGRHSSVFSLQEDPVRIELRLTQILLYPILSKIC